MKRYYSDFWGWGDIVLESAHYIVVRFDADPWTYKQIPTWEDENWG